MGWKIPGCSYREGSREIPEHICVGGGGELDKVILGFMCKDVYIFPVLMCRVGSEVIIGPMFITEG